MVKKKPRTEKGIPQNTIDSRDIQESLALKELLDRSKKSLREGKIEPLKDVMNDIRAKAKRLKSIPNDASGKTSKTAKTLKDLKGIIRELPKLGKDAEQFLRDIGNVKKLAGKYKGPTDLSGNHDVYHDLDHLAGTWSVKDAAEFQKSIEDLEVFNDIRQSPFTIKEAAEYLEAAETTVRRWVKNGSLKASNIGESIVFNVDDLKAFKNKRLS